MPNGTFGDVGAGDQQPTRRRNQNHGTARSSYDFGQADLKVLSEAERRTTGADIAGGSNSAPLLAHGLVEGVAAGLCRGPVALLGLHTKTPMLNTTHHYGGDLNEFSTARKCPADIDEIATPRSSGYNRCCREPLKRDGGQGIGSVHVLEEEQTKTSKTGTPMKSTRPQAPTPFGENAPASSQLSDGACACCTSMDSRRRGIVRSFRRA